MALSIDYSTFPYRIVVPQADLTNISGSLYELDTDALRLELKQLEAGENGILFEDTHRHNTEVTVAGSTFARTIEILNSTNSSNLDEFEIFFSPDTQYSVRLVGSNNNIFDIQNLVLANTTTQVIPTNSAGLIRGDIGSVEDVQNAVWDAPRAGHTIADTFGEFFQRKMLTVAKFLGLK